MRPVRYVTLLVGVLLLAGCMGRSVEQLNTVEPTGSPFTQQLALEYRELANFEAYEMLDWTDADYFAEKGLRAAAGEIVPPADLAEWRIPEAFVGELTDARARLVAALDGNGRTNFPTEAAIAQAKFDCWVEQQEENIQPDHIAACRDEFFAALALMEAPAMVAAPQYFVFFDFDRSAITAAGQDIIQQAAADWQDMGGTITVVGHTDLAGPAEYNMALSARRAAAVKQALVDAGVPADMIVTMAEGETQPLVPTPDGVREPSNRRAEIRFAQP